MLLQERGGGERDRCLYVLQTKYTGSHHYCLTMAEKGFRNSFRNKLLFQFCSIILLELTARYPRIQHEKHISLRSEWWKQLYWGNLICTRVISEQVIGYRVVTFYTGNKLWTCK